MKPYPQDFYANRHANAIHSAHTILSIVLARIPAVHPELYLAKARA